MLRSGAMKCALLVAAGVLAISSTASAGGYLGLGLGSQPALDDSLDSLDPQGRSLRGLAGIRFGNVSVEAALNGFDVIIDSLDYPIYQLSGALKLSIPLGEGFEVFGRGGLERTWLRERRNWSGDGFLISGGLEYRLNALVTSASVFVDYTVHRVTVTSDRNQFDMTSGIWGLGVTVGL